MQPPAAPPVPHGAPGGRLPPTPDGTSAPSRTVQFKRLTGSPRLYLARGFLTEGECDIMCRLAEGFGFAKTAYGRETSDLEVAVLEDFIERRRIPEGEGRDGLAFLESLQQRRSALSGPGTGMRILTPQVREMLPTRKTTTTRDPEAEGGDLGSNSVAIPMHLDTLVEDTYMTIIIYLRSVPATKGGQTLFPMATVDGASPLPAELLEASREMIASGIWGLENSDPRLDAAAERLAEQAAASGRRKSGSLVWGYGGHGLAVSAKRGDALCFYTRKPDGSVDPAAWHAVASLSPAASEGRCVCQLFHCLPTVAEAHELYSLSGMPLPMVLPAPGGIFPHRDPTDQAGKAASQVVLPNGAQAPAATQLLPVGGGPSPAAAAQIALYKQAQIGILHGKMATNFCKANARLRPCKAAGVNFEVCGDS